MKLQLSNFRTECDPRIIEVQGNPLLTYGELRAGDGVPGINGGDTRPVASFDGEKDLWVLVADESEWTDIEAVDGGIYGTADEPGLNVEDLRTLAHREYEIAKLMGPSDDHEQAWLDYTSALVGLTDAYLALVKEDS